MEITSEWKGSTRTAGAVASEIGRRWGEAEVKTYHPEVNCFTLRRWNQLGYRVIKGEKAIKSVTFISDMKKGADGKMVSESYPRTVNLFYIKQVQAVIS